MKITVVSDLHLEFDQSFVLDNPGSDVLILSGDICVISYLKKSQESPYYKVALKYMQFIKNCAKKWKHVVYVAGNHEYYGGYIDEEMQNLKEVFADVKNLHILDDEAVIIDDVLFVGSTLWFDGNKGNPVTLHILNGGMNDFHMIQWKIKGYTKFKPSDAVLKHEKSIFFIKEAIKDHAGKVVVCTHHSPCLLGIHPMYKTDTHMNGGYHSDLSNLILDNKINVWTHGHTHVSLDYMLGDTNIVCNPKGYKNENPDFDPTMIVEV